MQTEAANFIKLKEKKWHYSITSLAHEVISEQNFSKTVKMPKPDDIKKLLDYLKSEMSKAKMVATKEDFRRAVELVHVRLVTYNKKRPGELGHYIRKEDMLVFIGVYPFVCIFSHVCQQLFANRIFNIVFHNVS